MNAPDYRREGATVNLTVTINLLDATSAPGLRQQLRNLPLEGVDVVALDLGAVSFIDSSGVGALISLCKRLPHGALVRLTRVQPEVRSVLELMRLHRVFEITT